MKSCQVIASDKSTLLRKVDFLLKSGFQVIAFLIPWVVGYLVITVVNFVYKWARQLFLGHHKIMSDLFMFSNIFPIGSLISLWTRGFTIFQSKIPKWLLSNSKTINTCEDKKKRQTVPVSKQYVEKFDIKPSRLHLSDWNGERYASICQITNVVKVKW